MTTHPKAGDLPAAIDDLKARLHEAAPGVTDEQLTGIEASLFRLLTVTLNLSAGMAVDTVQLAFGRLSTLEQQMVEVSAHQVIEDERIDALEQDQHPAREVP